MTNSCASILTFLFLFTISSTNAQTIRVDLNELTPLDDSDLHLTVFKSSPKTCAIKTVATPWYKAVPSMFIVAPNGRTKLAIDFDTPRFSSQLSIFTGKVAALELVLNPIACTLLMDL